MKTVVKRAIEDERGAALALALVLLVIGGLILTPLLGLMSTGLLAGQVYEKKTQELYAADAGVEDAIWMIKFEPAPSDSWKDSAERPGWEIYHYPEPLSVGGKSVDVLVYRKHWDPPCGEDFTYQVLSTAISDDGGGAAALGSSTTIESYVDVQIVVRSLLDNAITSQDDVTIKPNASVNGTVQFGGTLDNKGTINGDPPIPEPYGKWPTFEHLSTRYWNQVNNLTATTANTINIPAGTTQSNPYIVGPLRAEPSGGTLTIDGPGYIAFNGTIYVKGSLDFKPHSGQNIDLNNSTIFAEASIYTWPKITLTGSGCIIAKEDITFHPSMEGNPDDFVFVLAIQGTVHFQPAHGTFYGSLAGNLNVNLWGDTGLVWHPLPEGVDINFPIEDYMYATNEVKTLTIRTWEIGP